MEKTKSIVKSLVEKKLMGNIFLGYCYICGDILHKGHREHLRNCKTICEKGNALLVVGVLSDKAIVERKPHPALPYHERFDAVKPYADIIVCQDEYSPLKNCMALRPSVLFESTSHKDFPANNFMKSIGGQVLILPYYSEESSSRLKKIIKEKTKNEDIKNNDSKPNNSTS